TRNVFFPRFTAFFKFSPIPCLKISAKNYRFLIPEEIYYKIIDKKYGKQFLKVLCLKTPND
ncbi:MAG: hypothetical protein KKH34_08805, partial [Candidatus Omnitrophica bacterium]|nr:hypothetical protein [Candidatus Omnitrophota bacterium]